jgi:hypothetical protein
MAQMYPMLDEETEASSAEDACGLAMSLEQCTPIRTDRKSEYQRDSIPLNSAEGRGKARRAEQLASPSILHLHFSFANFPAKTHVKPPTHLTPTKQKK